MKKVDTVLFDFDGTLMDTTEVIVNSWQHTFKTLEGKERPLDEIYPTFGEPLPTTMSKFFPDLDVDDCINIYRGYHYDNFGDLINLFPGMRELMDALKEQDYTLALVTSRMLNTTNQGLAKYDLDKYFDTVITCEDTDKHKPDPAPIQITLDRLDKSPSSAIMIGDTMFDILCAKNAGVKSVLVDWTVSISEDEKIGKDAPDHIIKEPMEILNILDELNHTTVSQQAEGNLGDNA